MSDELTDDALAGPFRVLQRRRGHRYSLDDVATAWEAARLRPEARNYLDLGCGIGSVLLMVAYKLAGARISGIEAQEISFELARRNVERNGLGERVRLRHGDLREPAALEALGGAPFDLITGTPPYFAPTQGTVSPDPQRAHARVELRGGVEAYLAASAGVLAPGGAVVVCADARTPARALEGGARVGLAAVGRRDVVPRAGKKGALFTVWTFVREGESSAACARLPDLIARDEGGGRTAAALELRRFFDLPVNEAERPSP